RDPIKQFSALLLNQGKATAEDLAAIDAEIDVEVRDSVEFALAAPEPNPDELTRYIWAED
ncbi:MAG: pyruvate dehydrogenase (acetyl-transferring) E1 component subunit alpha, partial [Synechococcaceae bacterium WBB_34_004]|nr:pyruvate dehydrogenase (acetyl-transferring) E1 component subunit alpha [Synechococcaceae bacterium WBB_34_004]